uniref:Uncharacterized protein n=1 Tax=Oryza brachyantha TaxID=4533 RepID=J3N9T5_ORYBR
MSALELHSVLEKMAAMRDGGGGWLFGVQLEFQELYTVLEKVRRKVAAAEPLVDSRSSAAYALFLADLRRVALTVDDALDSYSASTRRFPLKYKIRRVVVAAVSAAPSVTLRTQLTLMGPVPLPVLRMGSAIRRSSAPPEQPLASALRPKIARQLEDAGKDVSMLLRLFSTYVADLLPGPEHQQQHHHQDPGLGGAGPDETCSSRRQEANLTGSRQDDKQKGSAIRRPSAPPEQPLASALRPKIARQLEDAGKDVSMLLRLFSTYVADLLPGPEHQQQHHHQDPGLGGAGPDETCSSRRQEANLTGSRQDDKQKVLEILERPATGVVAIVGMAGVGKMALTRHVYRAAGADHRLWVQVSQDFNPEWIFRQVMDLLSDQLQPGEDAESFWWSLNEGFIDKKLLLVLDGVWNEDPRRWNELMHLLSGGSGRKSTKIIVTTRIPAAAAAIRSAAIYHLRPFSVDDTLRALRKSNRRLLRLLLNKKRKKKKPLGGRSGNAAVVSAAMVKESNARHLAERCSGLPGIIDLMSSSLRDLCTKQDTDPSIRFDMLCAQNQQLLRIAEASYSHLPPHLKRCFLYCSLFPYYHIFDVDELISLMMAEGLTQIPSREAQADGDFAQDLYRAIVVVGDDSAVLREHSSIRYMSLMVDHTTRELPGSLTEHTGLRTLILLRTQEMVLAGQKSEIREIPSEFCPYHTSLHVLDLHATKIKRLPETFDMLSNLRYLNISQTDIGKLPESIGRLQYLVYLNISQTCIATIPESIGRIHSLRYLNLSQTDVAKLPDSIGALRLLQTLHLSHCEKLIKLPQNIGSVTSLQKLDLEGCYYLSEMPQDISNLKNLKELNILECSSLDKMPCGLTALTKIEALPRYIATSGDNNPILELQDLVKLKRVGLENIENISNEDAEKIQLQKKHELEHLTLHCKVDADNRKSSSEAKELLDRLEPNPGLKTLEIISYAGETFPCWMASTNPQLQKLTQIRIIRLINLNCNSLPQLGQLHQLEILEISGMNAIKEVSSELHGVGDDAFRSLKKITFSHMLNLECWPVENGAKCEHLKELSIIQCPRFHKLSMNLNIEKLTIWMSPHELLGREGLAGVTCSLKCISISLCEELSTSSDCKGLTSLSSLEELKISGCDELERLPPGMEKLTALKRLSIIGCQKFQNLTDLVECTALRSLLISDCPMVTSVPKEFRGIATRE